MDEEIYVIERNNMWKSSDPSKGGQPIDKNLVKNELAPRIVRNPMSNKLAKEKNKLAKERNKSSKEKIKSSTKRVENKQITVKRSRPWREQRT